MIRPAAENPDDWETPQGFFDLLDREFGFTIDACAAPHNAKCDRYWTREQDALVQDWSGERVWCNPSYARETGRFVEKAALREADLSVLLIQVRTSGPWWVQAPDADELRFVKGRVKFLRMESPGPATRATIRFSSCTAAGKLPTTPNCSIQMRP